MSDLYEAIVYDENDAYFHFIVKATAPGNAIKKAQERALKRRNQIPKGVDRSTIMMTIRRVDRIHEIPTVVAFPASTRAQVSTTAEVE